MKRPVLASAVAVALAAAVTVAGCESAGLSPREVPGRSQSAYLYALYADMSPEARNAPLPPLRLPSQVAVVQIGEAAPPAPLIDKLRTDAGVFARVETLPGVLHEGMDYNYGNNRRDPDPTEQNRAQIAGLRSLASDLGMDYLLLVGGTVDYGTTATPLSFADLTIVGAFIVPSKETRATARANGALIDVRTGRVLVNSSADADAHSLVPSISVEGAETRLLEKLRDEVLVKLGERVLADTRLKAHSAAFMPQGQPAPASFPPPASPAIPAPGAVRHYDTVVR